MKMLTATVGLSFPFKPSPLESHETKTPLRPLPSHCLRYRRIRLFLRFLPFSILILNPLNPMLSKSDEIQILREAADKLGSGSYCGDWLREQIPFIECDIRSDFHPGIYASASIGEARKRADIILSEAKHASMKLERDSIAQSKARFDAADKELKRKVEGFRDILRECVNSL